MIGDAYEALAQDRLEEARKRLAYIQERYARDAAPKLRDLRAKAGSLLAQINRQIDEEEARDRERAALEKFRGLRDQAFFHDIPIPGLDPEGDNKAKRQAAEAALEVFKAPGSGDPWALALPPSPPAKAEIAEGCYSLLLILAGNETAAEQGLHRLDQANSLHLPPTRSYHLRRAACLAGMGRNAAAEDELRLAETLQPKGSLDHFLLGQECFKRAPTTGLQHFNAALQDRPGHFWAECLSALCLLDPRIARPEEAITHLNGCLQGRSDYAWLYLLRGFAFAQHARVLLRQANKTSPRQGSDRQLAGLEFGYAEMDYDRTQGLLNRGANGELRYALLINKGLLELQTGRPEKAVEDLVAAIKLNEKDAHAYAMLGQVYLDRERPDPDAAFEQFSRAIERDANRAEYYRSRAEVTLARPSTTPEQRAVTLRDLDRAIQLDESAGPHRLGPRPPGSRPAPGARPSRRRGPGRLRVLHRGKWRRREAHELRIKLLSSTGQHAEVIRACDELIARGWASPALYQRRALSRSYCNDYPRDRRLYATPGPPARSDAAPEGSRPALPGES